MRRRVHETEIEQVIDAEVLQQQNDIRQIRSLHEPHSAAMSTRRYRSGHSTRRCEQAGAGMQPAQVEARSAPYAQTLSGALTGGSDFATLGIQR